MKFNDLSDVERVKMLQYLAKRTRPDIPQLVFADSALWMMPQRYKFKEPYFNANPLTDFNS